MNTNRMNTLPEVTIVFLASLFVSSAFANDHTFTNVCSECHTGGFKGWVSGAPNVKKSHKWEKYLDRHSAEEMKQIVLNGLDDHKRKGGCKSCSDYEISAAVDYMLGLVR